MPPCLHDVDARAPPAPPPPQSPAHPALVSIRVPFPYGSPAALWDPGLVLGAFEALEESENPVEYPACLSKHSFSIPRRSSNVRGIFCHDCLNPLDMSVLRVAVVANWQHIPPLYFELMPEMQAPSEDDKRAALEGLRMASEYYRPRPPSPSPPTVRHRSQPSRSTVHYSSAENIARFQRGEDFFPPQAVNSIIHVTGLPNFPKGFIRAQIAACGGESHWVVEMYNVRPMGAMEMLIKTQHRSALEAVMKIAYTTVRISDPAPLQEWSCDNLACLIKAIRLKPDS